MALPDTFAELGPGVLGPVSGHDSTRVGTSAYQGVSEGYIDSTALQNPLRGVAVRAPKGTAAKVAYGFRSGPTGTTEPTIEGTGTYQAAAGQVNVATGGALRTTTDSIKFLVESDIWLKSGTNFAGKQEHANTADRTYTWPDKSGTVAMTSDIAGSYTDEQAQDAVGGILDDGSVGDCNFTYNDATPKISAVIDSHAISNGKMAQMPDYSIKANPTGGALDVQDIQVGDVTQETPIKGDYILGWLSTGELRKYDFTDFAGGGGSNALLDGSAHTDTVAQGVTRGSLIYGNSTPKWDELVIGASASPKKVLTSDGTDASWVKNQGDVVYTPTAGTTAINNGSDVTIATRNVTDVVAGDQILVEAFFTLLNNSGANRTYVITLDFDSLGDVEFTTPALGASATNEWPCVVQGRFFVASSSSCWAVNTIDMAVAGVASGGDSTVAATHLQAYGWFSSGSDATGTTTVDLKIRSSNATATQTCRLAGFNIRKLTP
jgi:hypothetical protein